MKISIEEVAGKKCTIIRRPFDAEWVREQLLTQPAIIAESEDFRHVITDVMITRLGNERWRGHYAGEYIRDSWGTSYLKHTVTILPALPRRPKPEDTKLLHRYAAEGLFASYECESTVKTPLNERGTAHRVERVKHTETFPNHRIDAGEITHCATGHGERVEVAITEGE